MKLRFLLLLMCGLIGCWPAKAEFQTDGGIQWEYADGTLTIKAAEGVNNAGKMGNYNITKKAPWHSQASIITSIVINAGVTSIGEYAFYELSQIKEIELPNSIISIGGNAFAYCKNLTSINIPAGVKEIQDFTFNMCDNLQSVTLVKGIEIIGSAAFNNCIQLKTIDLPEGITSIKYGAFSSTKLTSIILPKSLTTIGQRAFYYCLGLTSITVLNPVPVDIEDKTVFSTDIYSKCTLTVPAGAKSAFQGAEVWKEFYKIEENNAGTSAYHTITLDVADGIDLYNFSAGNHSVEEGGHLFLQFLPEDRTLGAADVLFLIDGVETEFNVLSGNNYFSYILNPIKADHTILIALRKYNVTLPEVEGVTYDVGAGTHQVAYGDPFHFSLTLADDIEPEQVHVYANGMEIQPDALRAIVLSYTIDKVMTPITIEIEGAGDPTGNTELSTAAIRLEMANCQLSIINATTTAVDVSVYSIQGKQVAACRIDNRATISLRPGIYLVKAGNAIYKVRIH